MQSALRAYLEKHPNSINDDPCYAANGTRVGHVLGTHTEMGLKGILFSQTRLNLIMRLELVWKATSFHRTLLALMAL